jgi:hypothetical protein
MKPEVSLPFSQVSVISSYTEAAHPVHITQCYFSKIHFNIMLPPSLVFPSGIFPSSFPTKIFYEYLFSPMCATCRTPLSILELIILSDSEEQISKCFVKGPSPEK